MKILMDSNPSIHQLISSLRQLIWQFKKTSLVSHHLSLILSESIVRQSLKLLIQSSQEWFNQNNAILGHTTQWSMIKKTQRSWKVSLKLSKIKWKEEEAKEFKQHKLWKQHSSICFRSITKFHQIKSYFWDQWFTFWWANCKRTTWLTLLLLTLLLIKMNLGTNDNQCTQISKLVRSKHMKELCVHSKIMQRQSWSGSFLEPWWQSTVIELEIEIPQRTHTKKSYSNFWVNKELLEAKQFSEHIVNMLAVSSNQCLTKELISHQSKLKSSNGEY